MKKIIHCILEEVLLYYRFEYNFGEKGTLQELVYFTPEQKEELGFKLYFYPRAFLLKVYYFKKRKSNIFNSIIQDFKTQNYNVLNIKQKLSYVYDMIEEIEN